MKKRGQIGTEYLIIISFVTFIVLSVLGIALLYTSQIQDKIKYNQLEKFASKITTSAESVFYSGEPARITITGYLPEGIQAITISGKEIFFNVTSNSGTSFISYPSKVELRGTLNPGTGTKKILIIANESWVDISQVQ